MTVDEQIERKLREAFAAHARVFPSGLRVQYEVRQGSRVPELVRLAAEKSADLICLGRVGANHDPLSDAAVQIVRKAPCSVLGGPAGADPRYERILVPVDFSDRCEEAIGIAASLAACTPGTSLDIQHVYTVPTGYHKTGWTYEEFARSMKGLSERQWSEVVPKLDFRGVPWSVRFDLSDQVPKTVLSAADEIDARLIVIGSHGRTRPSGVLLGHTAESVCELGVVD